MNRYKDLKLVSLELRIQIGWVVNTEAEAMQAALGVGNKSVIPILKISVSEEETWRSQNIQETTENNIIIAWYLKSKKHGLKSSFAPYFVTLDNSPYCS